MSDIFDDTASFESGEAKSTQKGYVNKNNQRCDGHRGVSGTDNLQRVYRITCLDCDHVYGANGTRNFESKCPRCQGGADGLEY
jgi:hypothetical protein